VAISSKIKQIGGLNAIGLAFPRGDLVSKLRNVSFVNANVVRENEFGGNSAEL
jgi:hypothetical protein